VGIRDATENEIEMQILVYFNRYKKIPAYKNPSAGYYDPRLKRMRKHINPYALNGTPDIYVPLRFGIFLSIEVKSAKGRQSEEQQQFERMLKATGGYYFICRSVEDAINAYVKVEKDISRIHEALTHEVTCLRVL
jgi:hypothetical protein